MEEDKKKNEIKPPVSKTPTHNVVVETFAEDMADFIGSSAGGLVKNIIHSEEEHEKETKNLTPQSKKNVVFMSLGFLLLAIALITSSFLFFRPDTNTVSVAKQFTPLIFNDQITPLEILGFKKDDIAQAVLSEIGKTKVKSNGVEGIYLTENKQTIGLRRFITLINAHFSPSDNPVFVSDNFLLGVVKNQANTDVTAGTGFFILIKVRSATDIFDSMRAWEPNLLTDLHGFLGLNISSDTNYLFTKDFQDGIVQNKNARILYDQKGNIVLMYLFADDNSVVITDSQNAAREIVLRLASSQIVQ